MTPSRLAVTFALGLLSVTGRAAVLDRVAVVVGDQVFTETEVEEEVRVTELLNGEPLDLSAAQKRAAANRLVDQALIRREMEVGGYDQPQPEQADAMLANLRRERFPTEAVFKDALSRYGVTEQELKRHLLWQLAALRFTDARFGTATGPIEEAANTRERSADANEPAVDQKMEGWLKQARSSTRIRLKQEAFQ
jgi:hypothetical protein